MYVLTVVGNVFVDETSGNVFVNKTRGTTQRVASITTCVGAQHVQQKKTTKVSWERWRSSLARPSSLRRSRGAASRPRRRRMYTWISPRPAGASSATGAIISMARHHRDRIRTCVSVCMVSAELDVSSIHLGRVLYALASSSAESSAVSSHLVATSERSEKWILGI